ERETLISLLKQFSEAQEISLACTEYAGGEALTADCVVRGTEFDLIFLDIFMPGMDGMETARALRHAGVDRPLVFLSTSPDFAVASYDVAALTYLLKPLSPEKLAAVMERFLKSYRPQSLFLQGRLFVARDIVLAESQNKNVLLRFKDGSSCVLHEKLDTVEARLTGQNFLRCHQSFVVNMDYVCGVAGEAFQTT
ncbi:MAG: LytTR family DNA-binding domain-containing protein, partial [Pseudoflavonifractor sp.]